MRLLSSVFLFGLVAQTAWAEEPKAKAATKNANPVVVMKTSMGNITIELNAEKAPITVKNFLSYVDAKHYDATIFHRVIEGFMIQGGGHDASLAEKPTQAPIKNEAANGLKNVAGSIAMARTNIPDSATAQFFINVVDNPRLDFRDPSPGGIGYCVFGKVIDGMDVVEKIKKVPTGNQGMMQNVPIKPVTIVSVRRK